jgi:hypothetical protein
MMMPRRQLTGTGAGREVARAKWCDGIVPFLRIEMPLLMLASHQKLKRAPN